MLYKFQENKILFSNFSCPFDSIKIYDKIQKNKISDSQTYSDLIKIFCGPKSNVTIYSTTSELMIKFETSDSQANGEYHDDDRKNYIRRGFKASFMFSKDFVDLSFVTGIHVKGTS